MTKRERSARSYSTPSPGQILEQKSARSLQSHVSALSRARPPMAAALSAVDVPCNPFRSIGFAQALIERGVMLAPLLVEWNYKIVAAKPFAKWLKTQDIILSDARLSLNEDTVGAHYFGTYIEQPPANCAEGAEAPALTPIAAQTLWGFSSEAAMIHMFDLCRGRIDRVSIVENDLRDFVIGLKAHINQAGQAHFSQTVLLAPAAM